MECNSWMHRVSAKTLIESCKGEFGWEELSRDVIMDVGCGVRGYGVQRILQLFPAVGTIIGICKDQEEVDKLKETTKKIEFAVADIEKRETLQNYEGRITKVISIHVFHQIMEKEEAFRNIYHLLKPGGEVAVLFAIKSVTYEWLTEMLKNPKWKDAYQGHYVEDLYKRELEASAYKKMVVNIGFQEVKCLGEKRKLAYPSDKDCKGKNRQGVV
ncbi:unnamed protein product [Larinioides sclopetarius]|uniref:Methyltransferase type 11 domain-containing protein n=1 Tax=Larinioides sclopetarius TaxID=280406 RepID=A0AAV2A1X1_9ARAC